MSDEISRREWITRAAAGAALVAGSRLAAGEGPSESGDRVAGWTSGSPRDEIRPHFAVDPHGGPEGGPCLLIRADAREGLDGYWTRTFGVSGGRHYRFSALYRCEHVAVPRRSVVAKLDWQD